MGDGSNKYLFHWVWNGIVCGYSCLGCFIYSLASIQMSALSSDTGMISGNITIFQVVLVGTGWLVPQYKQPYTISGLKWESVLFFVFFLLLVCLSHISCTEVRASTPNLLTDSRRLYLKDDLHCRKSWWVWLLQWMFWNGSEICNFCSQLAGLNKAYTLTLPWREQV